MNNVTWIYTKRDPLWLASMRSRYVRTAQRAAQGHSSPGDDERLREALAVLELSRDDFNSDVESIRTGTRPDRIKGVWPEMPGLIVREIIDDGSAVAV